MSSVTAPVPAAPAGHAPAPVSGPGPAPVGAPALPDDAAPRERRGKLGLVAVGAVFVAALGCFGMYSLWTAGDESTDDATVDADVVAVPVRAAGVVAELKVAENTFVHKGDPIVVLDDAELSARERQAEASVAAAQAQADVADAQAAVASAAARGGLSTAQAQVSTTRAQLASADAQVESAKAALARAQAEATRADADAERMESLISSGAVTKQALDGARASKASADAALLGAQAQLDVAIQARAAAQSRVAEVGGALEMNEPVDAKVAAAEASARLAHANLDAANAALDLAKLNLSYATVTAPADGTVTKLAARVGQLLVTGQQVASLVPTTTYVVANFKETQIGDMKPGDDVDVTVDSFGRTTFHGVVESVAPGTGSRFSLLAPDNASGNFVKVVQRVPVRIAWTRENPTDVTFRPGQSAVVTVHTGG